MSFYYQPKNSWSRRTVIPKYHHRPRSIHFSSFGRFRRRIVAILVIILIYFFLKHLPAPPKTQNNVSANRPPPERDLDVYPHFLYRSTFREYPDLEYEAKLEETLQQLELQVLREEGEGDANTIWQIMPTTADRSPDSLALEERNPQWRYRVATDDWAIDFVTNTLSSIPDLAALYKSYPYNVLRADLLRYLITWYYGGYYADADVWPARPINACPSLQPLFNPPEHRRNISLVLGVEIDEPYASKKLMREWHWSRNYGFIQYSIYAPRRFSPLLRRAVVRVLAHTKQHNDKSNWFTGPRYDEKTILEVTGPGVFTDAILDVLSETLPPTHPLIQTSVEADAEIGDLLVPLASKEKKRYKPASISREDVVERQARVTWAPFHQLKEPIWVDATEAAEGKNMGGLGVLPVSVWGNGQRHSGAENFRSSHACINHRFGRTWKKGWWEYFFG
ncbi:hypothetical protein VTO42DRAFT_959 [Malbranchea cinnamomea]